MCVRVKRSWYQLPRSSRLLLFVTLFTIVFLIYYHLQSIPKNIAPRYDVPGPIEPRFMSSISMQNGKFYLNNEELTIYSGAMHYFRVLPAMWRDRMQKMKAAGLNTIETYVAWNVHEEIQGEYQFDGHRDIRKYIQLAQEIGLYVIVRPGPFICAEWEFGGLPSWLLHDPDMIVRSTYLPFLDAANDYLYNLAKEISDLQFVYGGPIIAFQVENEYGSYGSDANYMIMVKRMLHANGYTELLFTSENVDGINNKMDGVLQTANLHDRSTAQRCFEKLRRVQPGLPLFVMELWSGWFDHWNEHHHTTKVQDLKDVLRYLIDNGASINFYMFHGGTNFGFMNGANEAIIDATTTSYDYDSPISENGTLTEKYYLIAELLRPFSNDLPPIKETYRSTAYGRVQMNSMMTFEDILSLNGKPIRSKYPLPMELLPINNDGGQGYGYIVYRKVIGEGRHLEIKGYIQDKAWILLNGRNIGTLNKNYNNPIVGLATDKLKNTVDIIVENTGRNNYVFTAGVTLDDQRKGVTLDDQRKGIIGEVYLDDILLEDWLIYPLEFKENFMKRAITEGHWQSVSGLSGPALWRGDLYIEQYKPKDSFLSVKGWGKGVAFVNDFNLGRYWPSAGPQKNLYLPGPLLKLGNNKILLFEMQSSGHSVGLIEQSVWIE